MDTGQQLTVVKGLSQVIIRPGVQALDPVEHLAFGGQHQNRHRAVPRSHLPCQLIAVQAGHHHVHDNQVINPKRGIFGTGFTVIRGFDRKAFGRKQGFQRIGKPLLVLDHQNAHIRTTS